MKGQNSKLKEYYKDNNRLIPMTIVIFIVSIFLIGYLLFGWENLNEEAVNAILFVVLFSFLYVISRFLDYYNVNKNRPLRLKPGKTMGDHDTVNYCGVMSVASFSRDNDAYRKTEQKIKYEGIFECLNVPRLDPFEMATSSVNIYFFCLFGIPLIPICAACEGFISSSKKVSHGIQFTRSEYGIDHIYFTEVIQVYFTYWGLIGGAISYIALFVALVDAGIIQ